MKLGGFDNPHALKLTDNEEVLVPSQYCLTTARCPSGKDPIIVAVSTDLPRKCCGFHQNDPRSQKFKSLVAFFFREFEFPMEGVVHLLEDSIGKDHFMFQEAVLQQFVSDALRDESRDQDVGVQNQSHETRLNTSSSV